MQEDERCCGTGTCIVDAHGLCWCGQQWDGTQMCRPVPGAANPTANTAEQAPAALQTPPAAASE